MIILQFILIATISALAGMADASADMGGKKRAVNMRIVRDLGILFLATTIAEPWWPYVVWIASYRVALHGYFYALYRTDLPWYFIGTTKGYDIFIKKYLSNKYIYALWIVFWLIFPIVIKLIWG